jgi:BirA family biotin operon repressor/biotin-[acetyl-CoA-carboxylase] ligase
MSGSVHAQSIPVLHLATVDSTMLEARRRIASGAVLGPFMIRSDEQSGGYGRHGRAWHSPRGGIWATLAWPMDDRMDDRALGLRIGVAACRLIEELLGSAADIRLKWPNDVLVGGSKICGVLCERVSERSAPWLLVGVGINANNEPATLPTGLRRPATSLALETHRESDVGEVARRLVHHLGEALCRPLSEDTLRWAAARLWQLDQPIRATTSQAGQIVEGKLSGLSADGRLVIETPSGRVILPEGSELLS